MYTEKVIAQVWQIFKLYLVPSRDTSKVTHILLLEILVCYLNLIQCTKMVCHFSTINKIPSNEIIAHVNSCTTSPLEGS